MLSQGEIKNSKNLLQKSEAVSVILKQMSHPQRLMILCSLMEGEKTVKEIEKSCEASQSAVSQFLKVMRLEGLVASRRDGKQNYYKIADKRVFRLIKAFAKIFC